MDGLHKQLWLATAMLTTPILAQFGGFGGGGGGFGPGSDGDDNDNNDDSPFGFANGGLGFDVGTATRQRMMHGVLASVAFVILLPLGAIGLRFLPGRLGFWVHAVVQVVGWLLFVVAAALGFVLVREVSFPGSGGEGWMLSDPSVNYHPILGIIIFVLIAFQPALGYLHHRQFKLHQRRTLFSHLHLWNGRVMIILGIVNGGLGLKVSNASDMAKLVYTIVAAVLGGTWAVASLLGELRRSRGRDAFGRTNKGGVKGFWRKENGRSIRMDRIDKAVRAESDDGGHGAGARRYA